MIGPPSRSCGHSRVSLGTPLSLLDMCVTSAGAAGYCLALRSRWIWSLSAVGGGVAFTIHIFWMLCYIPPCVCVLMLFLCSYLLSFFLVIWIASFLWFRIRTSLMIYRTYRKEPCDPNENLPYREIYKAYHHLNLSFVWLAFSKWIATMIASTAAAREHILR